MKKLLADHVLSWCSLILGCLALLIAGGLLLGGCGADRSEYQDVVDQVNAKYHEQLSVDLDHVDITPEQLRAHLEAVAQSRREAIPAADAAGHLSRVNAQKSKNIFYEARMRAISSRKSCSEHR